MIIDYCDSLLLLLSHQDNEQNDDRVGNHNQMSHPSHTETATANRKATTQNADKPATTNTVQPTARRMRTSQRPRTPYSRPHAECGKASDREHPAADRTQNAEKPATANTQQPTARRMPTS